MKNIDQWRPTKFIQTNHGLRASRDPAHVGIGSRFIADIIARQYETALLGYAHGRLLDLGCGHVPLYGVYRGLVTETICVDWENTSHSNGHLDQAFNLEGEWPLESESFDTVLMTDVLEHLPCPLETVEKVCRLLHPGGTLILGVPFFYWVHERPFDYYRYTEYALRRFCRLSNLKIRQLTAYGGLPEVLIDLTSKGIDILPTRLSRLLRPLHSSLVLLNRTMPFRKMSEWTRNAMPLGYTLIAEKDLSAAARDRFLY